jgi:putative ABC transport system permease protein
VNDILYMAWRYVRFHWGKTVLLVSAISLVLFLPAGLHVVVEQGAQTLTARAEVTPLLIGARGSAVDLTLSALYFRPPNNLAATEFGEVQRVNQTGLAIGIPLHLRYTVRAQRIVGTTLDYVDFRSLALAQGRWFGLLGECVMGSEAARVLGVDVGDQVLSSAGSAFDVAGAFPLKMPVVGVLEPTGTPDDDAVFVDIKTTWIISGLAHGHENVNEAGPNDKRVLEREDDNVVANPTVLSYTEITPENVDSVHFHGDPERFPVDAIIAAPDGLRSGVLLRGRYEESGTDVQMLVPSQVVADVLETMFSVRNYVVLGSIGVSAATLMTAALVFVLSIRLRRREIETIRRIGGSSRRLVGVLASEILLVVIAGVVFAGLLTVGVSRFGDLLVRFVGS